MQPASHEQTETDAADKLNPSRQLPGWEVERGTAEVPPAELRLEVIL